MTKIGIYILFSIILRKFNIFMPCLYFLDCKDYNKNSTVVNGLCELDTTEFIRNDRMTGLWISG